ncbi:DUF6305 family protein [Clostridium thailandense]|uniref:DUF6305 family protein n=1 Tax=Clostridium thailandense TaxID=2794346 RepID=UPI003989E538
MKLKSFIFTIIVIFMIFVTINSKIFEKKKEINVLLLPSLPNPIAKEYVLITSAGQSTEAYIINDVANKLMIHNYFMPQAKMSDLKGINTIVIVVGTSPLGEKLNNINIEDEKKRVEELLKEAKKEKLVVITVYMGGKERRDKSTDELLSIICPQTNYLIGTKEANYDNFLSEAARSSKIPLTLINTVSDIIEPFSSAFR